jgi:hypothetical protein
MEEAEVARIPVVYVAGPFRAESHWDQELNIRRAEAAALEIWGMGAACICPHTNTRYFQGAAPDEVWLKGDLEILRRCDAIYMVKGWLGSEGATKEYNLAGRLNMPVLFDLAEVKIWLERRRTKGDLDEI